MQNDIFSALTQEVKEEVVQKYLYKRRLVEEQFRYLNKLAEKVGHMQEKFYMCTARMYDLLNEPEFIDHFVNMLGQKDTFFAKCFEKCPEYRKSLNLIKVHGFTTHAKFRKLFLESYRRLYFCSDEYKKAYEDLQEECRAVNHNAKKFEEGHDLLTIMSFLKSMDIKGLEKKYFLGDNFTPDEITSLETTLHFKPVRMAQFKLVFPTVLPNPQILQKQLSKLADSIYTKYRVRIKHFIK